MCKFAKFATLHLPQTYFRDVERNWASYDYEFTNLLFIFQIRTTRSDPENRYTNRANSKFN